MKTLTVAIWTCLVLSHLQPLQAGQASEPAPPNPHIDYDGFLKDAVEVGKIRAARRVTEEQFLSMAAESGTLILDARTADKYALVHIKGAVNLPLTDATEESLSRAIPDKTTRILIYCNNNFGNEPEALMTKRSRASLNIYTFNTLYSYGYANVYELGPFLDIFKTRLPLEGSKAAVLQTEKP